MFRSLFQPSISISRLCPDGMDAHCHLLPGVDDGAQNTEQALGIINGLRRLGITTACCTPHIMLNYPDNTPETLRRHHQNLCETLHSTLTDTSFTLHLAAEYMCDEGFERALNAPGGPLTLPGNRILIELPQYLLPTYWMDHLLLIQNLGYTPVLAHPERYHRILSYEEIAALTTQGIQLQGNLGSLTGLYGSTTRTLARRLLKQNLYSLWGTDTHSPHMLTRLKLKR